MANGSKFRFVNTHLQSAIPGLQQAEQVQREQADELLASLLSLAHRWCWPAISTPTRSPGRNRPARRSTSESGFVDAWKFAHPADPGYTWPLFGEDQNSGPVTPMSESI